MNRKEKRELRKDKNLIKGLYEVINKYLPELLNKFEDLKDLRNQSYVTYKMRTICVTRLFGLLCGLTSLTAITDKFDTEESITNLSHICKQKLEELPYWETIQDVFINLDLSQVRVIGKYIVVTLLRSKMFDKYKYEEHFQLLFDGTGLSNHDYNLNDNCLIRKHKDGNISYYKYVLECKLVVGNIVISVDSEFIENHNMLTEAQKQDCETNAFKRMIKRIKKNYPKYKFIITGDALYATDPIISIVEKYKWKYIFNFKPDRLKELYRTFEGNIMITNESAIPCFYLSTDIPYQKHFLNIFKYVETKLKRKKEIKTIFRYISNLAINDENIKEILFIGRSRWKIENEGFYTQKHRTFNITHLNSRNDNAMKAHYFFIQFAHTIRQLFEQGHSLVKLLKLKIKEVSILLLKSLTSHTSELNFPETNFQLRFDT